MIIFFVHHEKSIYHKQVGEKNSKKRALSDNEIYQRMDDKKNIFIVQNQGSLFHCQNSGSLCS